MNTAPQTSAVNIEKDTVHLSQSQVYQNVECSHCTETNSLGAGTLTLTSSSLIWQQLLNSNDQSSSTPSIITLDYVNFCLHGVQTEEDGKRSALFITMLDQTDDDDADDDNQNAPTLSIASVLSSNPSTTSSSSSTSPSSSEHQDTLYWFYLSRQQCLYFFSLINS